MHLRSVLTQTGTGNSVEGECCPSRRYCYLVTECAGLGNHLLVFKPLPVFMPCLSVFSSCALCLFLGYVCKTPAALLSMAVRIWLW